MIRFVLTDSKVCMYKSLVSVGALTLLSRAAGFFRDVLLGAVLGAGMLADAFVVAQRLPNHFRTIFGEGAFNSAYVPSYARVLQSEGLAAARVFSGQIFLGLLASQIILLALAWIFTPYLIDLLAPGFRDDPEKFALTVTLTRITFPYLLFITLVTLQSGTLNAHGRFTAAAMTPVVMNLSMIVFLSVAFLFSNPGLAASWGLTVSGVLQLALTAGAAHHAGIFERFTRPSMTKHIKHFLTTLGPAVIGSAGAQIALFADTIIGSLLPTGGPSSIYYADRIYQLPLGVIGIAAGTVLLPEMSRLLAAGNPGAALHAQNRTMALTLAVSAPFFIAFIMISDSIMRGVFLRGAFTAYAAQEFGRRAHSLWIWAYRDRAPALGSTKLPGPWRYNDADADRADRCRDQCRLEDRPVQAIWSAGAGCRHGSGRLDQSHAFVFFRDPARLDADRFVFLEGNHYGHGGVLCSSGLRSLCRGPRSPTDREPRTVRQCP